MARPCCQITPYSPGSPPSMAALSTYFIPLTPSLLLQHWLHAQLIIPGSVTVARALYGVRIECDGWVRIPARVINFNSKVLVSTGQYRSGCPDVMNTSIRTAFTIYFTCRPCGSLQNCVIYRLLSRAPASCFVLPLWPICDLWPYRSERAGIM